MYSGLCWFHNRVSQQPNLPFRSPASSFKSGTTELLLGYDEYFFSGTTELLLGNARLSARVAFSGMQVNKDTTAAKTKKGNRPSYINAAKPELAIPLYEKFTDFLRKESGLNVYTGKFGADMKVSLINDGPVTIILDSKEKNF